MPQVITFRTGTLLADMTREQAAKWMANLLTHDRPASEAPWLVAAGVDGILDRLERNAGDGYVAEVCNARTRETWEVSATRVTAGRLFKRCHYAFQATRA